MLLSDNNGDNNTAAAAAAAVRAAADRKKNTQLHCLVKGPHACCWSAACWSHAAYMHGVRATAFIIIHVDGAPAVTESTGKNYNTGSIT